MPGFNGRGPAGAGPMTGRGGGYCMGLVAPEDGLLLGRGGGRGRWNCFNALGSRRRARVQLGGFLAGDVYTPAAGGVGGLDLLRAQAGKLENLENALEEAKKRIQELEARA